MPPVTKMRFMACVIASLCSLKCFGTCFESPVNNYNYENYSVSAMETFRDEEIFNAEKMNFSASTDSENSYDEYFVNAEPVISDPVFEDTYRNISGAVTSNRKREVPEALLTFENKMRILHLHNIYRGNVTPPAANMAFMVSSKLRRILSCFNRG